MAVIGFRCYPCAFAYVVLDGTQAHPTKIASKNVKCPKGLGRGELLAWVRKEVLEILQEYPVTAASIKRAETSAMNQSLERSEIEGILKEAIYTALGREVNARVKAQVRSAVAQFRQPARYLVKILEQIGLEGLDNETYQEAALVAVAELPV